MTNTGFDRMKVVAFVVVLAGLAVLVMLNSVAAAPNSEQQAATGQANVSNQFFHPEVLKSPFYNPLQVALLAWYPANTVSSYTYAGNPNPNGIAFDGTNIWVADENGEKVVRWRASDGYCELGAGLCTYTAGSSDGPFGLAYDGRYMWVTNRDASTVSILDGQTMTSKLTCSTHSPGSEPYSLAFDGTSMWVTNETDGVGSVEEWPVALIESTWTCKPTTLFNAATPCTFNVPTGIAYDNLNNTIWVANSGNVGANTLTGIKNGVCASYNGARNPLFLAFDGINIWATNHSSSTVTRFTNGTHPKTLKAQKNPCGIVFDGRNMWISNENGGQSGNGSVTVIDTTTLAPGKSFVGNGMTHPCEEAFDGANVWVTNQSSTNPVDKM